MLDILEKALLPHIPTSLGWVYQSCSVFVLLSGWEHLLAGSILADQFAWHENWQQAVLAAPCSGYEIHVIRGDATNSSAAQREKVHSCMATSSYCTCLDGGLPEDEPLVERTRTCFADLRYIPSGCTAKDLFEIYNLQMMNMGVPTLFERDKENTKPLRIFAMVSDDGPDQKGCDKLAQESLKYDDRTLFFRYRCFLHQIHLIVAKQLKRLSGLSRKKFAWILSVSM